MKSKRVEILAAAVVLFVSVSPVMAGIHYNDGGTYDITTTINDNVWVDLKSPGVGTTLNILDGATIPYPYHVTAWEGSIINILGGWVYHLYAYDSSQVTVSGGSMKYLYAYDSSQVTVSGGWMDWLGAGNSGQVAVSGGSIGGKMLVWGNGVLTIHGWDFAVDGMPVGYTELYSIFGGGLRGEPYRQLTGTLLSGDPLNNGFRIGYSGKIVLVPEPATILLLGLGGLALLRKRRL